MYVIHNLVMLLADYGYVIYPMWRYIRCRYHNSNLQPVWNHYIDTNNNPFTYDLMFIMFYVYHLTVIVLCNI